MARLRGECWWPGWLGDVSRYIQNCLLCAVTEDRKPGRQTLMNILHRKQKFSVDVFKVQTITSRTEKENIRAVVIIDVSTRFLRAVPFPNETDKTVAQVLIDSRISIFGLMQRLLSDR